MEQDFIGGNFTESTGVDSDNLDDINPVSLWYKAVPGDDEVCLKYTRLSDSPEVMTAIERIADLISSMTIMLMKNTNEGDVRVKNGLSRKLDISPCTAMTRQTWMTYIVKSLLLTGNAIVYPKITTRMKEYDSYIQDLIPIPSSRFGYKYDNVDFRILIDGIEYKSDEVLHFLINPRLDVPYVGEGYKIALRNVVDSLGRASNTKKDFMANKMTPSLIVKIDALTDDFDDESSRQNLAKRYIHYSNAGEPWIIPGNLIEVEQIKPLSLNDIAINETVELDKLTVASILGVPPYLLGVGSFSREEYNNFIKSRILPIAKSIEQELTKKLIYSPDMYVKFNIRSLYSYSLFELAQIGASLYTQGIMTGNEVRDWVDLSPKEGLDDLIILENYINLQDIDKQKKLDKTSTKDGGGD